MLKAHEEVGKVQELQEAHDGVPTILEEVADVLEMLEAHVGHAGPIILEEVEDLASF